jgi:CDP-diacylglycerol--glycerol-3-phosphate 3-phosphatidyltransferase
MGLYSMRSGKDTVLFRLASIAHTHGLTPNMMTTLGLCFGVASGIMFCFRAISFALAFGFLSVFCDTLDGTIARKFQLETKFGRVFDSVADRAAEVAVVLGALAGGIIAPIGLLAIVGSASLLLFRALSYTRGLNTNYVLFGRVERLACILLGLMAPSITVSTFCFVIAGGFGLVSTFQIVASLMRHPSTKAQLSRKSAKEEQVDFTPRAT